MFATKNFDVIENKPQNYPQLNQRNFIIWSALSFQAGCINAGGFLACFRFVTHTTGFATQFGYDLAVAKWSDALGMLTVPLFFMAGSMISGFYVDRRMHKGLTPQFHISFLLSSVFLFLVLTLGFWGTFGPFGQTYDPIKSYLLIALLCLASGIQNAVTTTASHNTLRTTHLTGHTTDLGIGLMRVLDSRHAEKNKSEIEKNKIRGLVIVSFILGSAASSSIYLQIGYLGFILPFAISLLLYLDTQKRYVPHA